MSQQKFASNVVEKCLTFGDPSERQLLVTEMLGTTDENEPLQVCHIFFLSFDHSAEHECYYLLAAITLILVVWKLLYEMSMMN